MKKLFGIALLALLGSLPARADFVDGTDYARVPAPQAVETGKKIEVREFFWYGCPHCYALEPSLEKWVRSMPKNAEFVRTPAVFNDRWAQHAHAYYAFEALGITGKMHGALFNALHVEKQPLFDADSIADYVGNHGGDRKAFLEAFRSFGVTTSVNRAAQLGQAFKIESVPTMIVDGKYRTDASMAGSHERMLQVVEFLIRKSAGERGKK